MRHANLNKLTRPAGWDARAELALNEVSVIAAPDRKTAINCRRNIWGDLKPRLEELSNKKCWYCESKEIRSDKHVDHFRPKNRVNEPGCETHPGYWWLAFDWKNYRYSCTFCNCRREDGATGQSGGKANRFPLKEEARRCWNPGQPLCDEQPVLLDPTIEADPGLLWFDEEGYARPNCLNTSVWPYERANASISIYNLNHTDLKEARQGVCRQCKQIVSNGDLAWEEYSHGAAVAQARFEEIVRRLRDLVDPRAEYSATARCTIMGLRSQDRPWLDAVLAAA